jgi:hypothetical protein
MNRETSHTRLRWRTTVVVLGLLAIVASGPALAIVFSGYEWYEPCGCWIWWPDI